LELAEKREKSSVYPASRLQSQGLRLERPIEGRAPAPLLSSMPNNETDAPSQAESAIVMNEVSIVKVE
jgi:hypothetical protein